MSEVFNKFEGQNANGELISAEIDEAATESTRLRIEDKLARLRHGDHLKEWSGT